MPFPEFKLNWKPAPPDERDQKFQVAFSDAPLPPAFEHTRVPVLNQLSLGSCTCHMARAQTDFLKPQSALSRLFLYYIVRQYEGTLGFDNGAYIRDIYKVLRAKGCCQERYWPYNLQKWDTKPPASAFLEATNHQALRYRAVPQNLTALKQALQQGPVGFGFQVYDSIYNLDSTHTLPMPKTTESSLGGHAVCLWGWDDARGCFLVRNSWGKNFGDKGYFWMPYEYVLKPSLSSDFWLLQEIE